jgi:hypothetical protein
MYPKSYGVSYQHLFADSDCLILYLSLNVLTIFHHRIDKALNHV